MAISNRNIITSYQWKKWWWCTVTLWVKFETVVEIKFSVSFGTLRGTLLGSVYLIEIILINWKRIPSKININVMVLGSMVLNKNTFYSIVYYMKPRKVNHFKQRMKVFFPNWYISDAVSGSADDERCLILTDVLVKPLQRRFSFHFYGARRTNNLEKVN